MSKEAPPIISDLGGGGCSDMRKQEEPDLSMGGS